ncbi:MAG: tRNA uridine(34) 5-carboxymethylaminomethyl modification radical SAM/GNAT enzyme Elp3 [Thermofilaceae archaeon]|nr:tRNA uridine(34) 5-carboxymethylaminomethyl modification radical SAM/GNAT enzyme Elp3 [Thermofilaceae archaeon]MCX8179801.1 tRNA uridine(34) 5-carboxymethylaminomethyl modification radical SAM/GNAT enzyme Elp3 [Thermofilaceae archaeon]MDW8004328.1 tRNA uridine(34) 5-carboxymethylaminomethyl modification radical SAM/GNAT enzyme Elp3 [Thermofilaceae archaeon]
MPGKPRGSRLFQGIKKPTRTLSGVTVVSVMTQPYPCPHGRCLYCPGGPSLGTPQSYVKTSPAVARAERVNYHPYEQVRLRLKQYVAMGYKPSKVELIVMGGTFPAMPLDYQEWVVAQSLEALNRFPEDKPGRWVYLEEAMKKNETAAIRCVGLTLETRPDWCKEKHVDLFLHLGATRVELGVQTVHDDVLTMVGRGHTVDETVEATRVLKDSGYKIAYHVMLGLPGSDPDIDFEAFKTIYEDPRFKPDMVKIYPTLVVPGAGIFELWKNGLYKPYDMDTLLDLIAKIKSITPPWVRIMRVQRDIPLTEVAAGPPVGNLREVVWSYMSKKGLRCRCIRCREIGRYALWTGEVPRLEEAKLMRRSYEASEGFEEFISYEDPVRDALFGFVRLRVPSQHAHRWEVDAHTAIIRELHVYGPETPVGEEGGWWQHIGLGKRLVKAAEDVARNEYGVERMLVISAVGTREYYRKLGYEVLQGSFYMFKNI